MGLLRKWVQIYRNEMTLFLWVSAAYFLIRSSTIIFANFTETTFLKRYGVAYLPLVYMINAAVTFPAVSLMAMLQKRVSAGRLLAGVLLFCGVSIAVLRFLIPYEMDTLYPVLFVLKGQYEILLGLLFWTVANDLFDARQSKRIFPLITAGGLIGSIIGSFATPAMADIISTDNLMMAYLCMTVAGAVTVKWMGRRFPHRLLKKNGTTPLPSSHVSMTEQFKQIPKIVKSSNLIKVLILLNLLPNVVFPILNFQFRFAVNQYYATEGGLLGFFGYFMGSVNTMNLFILLFVGRIFGRWGLPAALMFHPANYLLAFLALLFRFDIFGAVYARLSTTILRTTINKPARAALMGLLPKNHRDIVRSFLRGVAAKIGIIAGSLLVLLSESYLHPRYLSIPACVFVGGWMMASLYFKRHYLDMLLNIISKQGTAGGAENRNLADIFKGKEVQKRLLSRFSAAGGKEMLWYGRLLRTLKVPELDERILQAFKTRDEKTQIGLLSILSTENETKIINTLRQSLDPSKEELMIAIVKSANRLSEEAARPLNLDILDMAIGLKAKSHAVAGLYRSRPEIHGETIRNWLNSSDQTLRQAGIIAAGRSEDPAFAKPLKALLKKESATGNIIHVLKGLARLKTKGLSREISGFLYHAEASVRHAALESFEIKNDDHLKHVIQCLGDSSLEIRKKAISKILNAPYQNNHLLITSLYLPDRHIQKGLQRLLDSVQMPDLNIGAFVNHQLKRGYDHLICENALGGLPQSVLGDTLVEHLRQERRMKMENLLRVMAAKDTTGKMKIIRRGISSDNGRRRSNSLEALDQFLDRSLSRFMMPLMDNTPKSRTIDIGRKHFRLPHFKDDHFLLFSHLLENPDWVTTVLTLALMAQYHGTLKLDSAMVQRLNKKLDRKGLPTVDAIFKLKTVPFLEKLIFLKGIQILKGLSIGEIAGIALHTSGINYSRGEVVIQAKEPVEAIYFIMKGKVSVLNDSEKRKGTKNESIDQIGINGFFGEAALIDSGEHLTTVRTLQESQFLLLPETEFIKIAHDFPLVLLRLAGVLGHRLRKMEKRLDQKDL